MTVSEATPYAPGARIEVRDTEWMVRTCTPTEHDGYMIRAIGVSELVRDEDGVFFTGLDDVNPLRPEDTELVADDTPRFAKSRLYLESVLRRTPLPQSERGLALPDRFLLNPHAYQQRPAELALKGLRPRVLIADVVGLGKTLEIGLTLAELIRRGRGERILVVTPQQVLEQFQHELWTRFAIPLVRLDSVGLERIQRDIPAGRNPFLYYKRVIISVDTLKNQGKYGQHLRSMHWDAVVIDESHNVINKGNLRNDLAALLAMHTDALLLASATPHNGVAESFAELISLLDPAAIVDKKKYSAKDIEHLYIRRTKVSSEVRDQIGGKWPARGPSEAIHCTASKAEEAVFRELKETWLPGPAQAAPVIGRDRRLFPYTLAKAFLSSPKALSVTVGKRIENATEPREIEALGRLARLTAEVRADETSKLKALVTKLKEIGVDKGDIRAVVFSESVPTLQWLQEVVPGEVGLKDDQVEIMHGGLSDQQQQGIVENFSLADSKVRVLFTGDVASEGVNLHRQCHHLIHYDLPWSLIRIEQRNGRIDRYGQTHQPRFSALILKSSLEGALDDTTVSEKLLRREEQAHNSLGTAEAVTGEFSAKKEEDRLIKDLFDGKTVEQALEQAEGTDALADLLGAVGEQRGQAEPPRASVPRLFASTEEFVREALDTVAPELKIDDDGALLAFEPPADLVHRLSALPASYLRTHKIKERMKVTFDRDLAQRKLDEARKSKTFWPDIAYLSDLHPLVEWVVDKVQVQLVRQQAPVLTADVAAPTFLVQGIYSNALGQPTVVEWMAVSGLPDAPVICNMTEVLAEAGVGPHMINTSRNPDLERLGTLVRPAVDAARKYLDECRTDHEAEVDRQLEPYESRVVEWEQASLEGIPEDWRAAQKRDSVRTTAEEQRRLVESMRTTGEPLLRILAVLEGDK
ncbi:RNA polymerase-associated protein RapA [Actinomadura rubteroloni]|uniref:RNA polymerase-associated protein RapA n=1 Tax=Actinomadura rubteroloni TaxID=1926885 RepID=A0A2P4UM26_9ACTN|nr:DEAD/DEAH box helicase [Actinomadura rubteroloni]POM26103.1 RNA polymerase-associated protein RapA [Actinomadura rubteroloni]